jgi:Fur family transcriptional regulator, zinc uptake regulator
MSTVESVTPDLTRNQSLVLDVLAKSEAPLSAYNLLDQLRAVGFRAPLQVYRALDKLVEQGRVHRLESLSAFVACQDPACIGHAATVFMICEKCGKVSERSDSKVARELRVMAKADGFTVNKTNIELHGACGKC